MCVYPFVITISRSKVSVKTNITKDIFSFRLTGFVVSLVFIFSKSWFGNLIVGKRRNAIM